MKCETLTLPINLSPKPNLRTMIGAVCRTAPIIIVSVMSVVTIYFVCTLQYDYVEMEIEIGIGKMQVQECGNEYGYNAGDKTVEYIARVRIKCGNSVSNERLKTPRVTYSYS